MNTISGIRLVAGIALNLIGILCLIIAVMQFRQKGPVCSTSYFAASENIQKTMRTKKAYHYAGNVFSYLTLISLLFGGWFLFDLDSLALMATVILCSSTLSGIIYVSTRN